MKRGRNSRGMSTIIATLLIILLTMIAVGIVWVVVRNVIQKGSEEVSLGKFTLNFEIKNVVINETSNISFITIKRNPGEGKISGLNFIFDDGKNSQMVRDNNLMNELDERIIILDLNPPVINISGIQKVSVYPIFELESGKEAFGEIKEELTKINFVI